MKTTSPVPHEFCIPTLIYHHCGDSRLQQPTSSSARSRSPRCNNRYFYSTRRRAADHERHQAPGGPAEEAAGPLLRRQRHPSGYDRVGDIRVAVLGPVLLWIRGHEHHRLEFLRDTFSAR